jgi:proteasome assembly chaperone (PAC2) family protein
VQIEEGRVVSMDLPRNVFHAYEPARLALFLGKEPQLRWRSFGDAIFQLAGQMELQRILFVGSFGGSVPHTREPRLFVAASNDRLLGELAPLGLRRTGYQGPGSFTSYLMTRGPEAGLEVGSLVAEIPGYLQGRNPMSIEAVTRRLAKALKLSLDLKALRTESTEWELSISAAVEQDENMAELIHKLEQAYDDELLQRADDTT